MSTRELERVEIFGRVASKQLRLLDAMLLLELSYRQVKRLWKRFRKDGAEALKHGNAGRSSNRAKATSFRQQVLQRVREKYWGEEEERFGPTLAAEHLGAEDGLQVDGETLRRWMLAEGLWSRQRKRQSYRRRRERKAHFGELVQMDGSFHAWFERRGPRGCLLNMVDDATGINHGRLGKEETIWAAVAVLRGWIEQYEVPLALYTDWKNLYKRRATVKEQLAGVVPETQFGRMCTRLGIQIIAALAAGQGEGGAPPWHPPGSAGEEAAAARHTGLCGRQCVPDETVSARAQPALRTTGVAEAGLSSSGADSAGAAGDLPFGNPAPHRQRLGGTLSHALPATAAQESGLVGGQAARHRVRVRRREPGNLLPGRADRVRGDGREAPAAGETRYSYALAAVETQAAGSSIGVCGGGSCHRACRWGASLRFAVSDAKSASPTATLREAPSDNLPLFGKLAITTKRGHFYRVKKGDISNEV